MKLTHVDEQGRARMVDVSEKPTSERTAVAEGAVRMSREAFDQVTAHSVEKGDVLGVAQVAGTCHPLTLDLVQVDVQLEPELPGVRVTALARAAGKTGVEMEALTAVAVACLTVYDMVKAIDRSMSIEDVRLVSKSGGTRGDWRRAQS